jgi:hypothetical protein
MHQSRKSLAVLLCAVTALIGVVPSAASARVEPSISARQAPESSATVPLTQCPWITDSIVRLYSAYLSRPPDAGGFIYWLNFYENGIGLEEISENFALSQEFVNTYGTLNSADFVALVYRNVLGREPDQGGFNYWKGLLDSGAISYGGTMLSFSESKEYVLRTGTVRPAAGYLLWFDEGTNFYCGIGSADVVVPFPSGSLGYVMLPPASGRAWGHEFDVYLPGAAVIFKNNPYDPSIPNTATVLSADFENLENYVFRLSVEPDIRWSLNLATGGQPDNLDTWLGDPTVPRS